MTRRWAFYTGLCPDAGAFLGGLVFELGGLWQDIGELRVGGLGAWRLFYDFEMRCFQAYGGFRLVVLLDLDWDIR